MKKTLLTVIALCLAVGAFAQFEQGRMMIGGQLSIQSYKEKQKSGSTTVEDGTTTDYSFTPQFGYFVIDNLAVGAGISNGFSSYNPDDDDIDNSTSTSFQFQPFARYYLPQHIFFQATFGAGGGTYKDSDGDKESYGISSWSLAGGYSILLNDHVAIEPILGYGVTKDNYKDADPDYKYITSGLFIQVGIQVYLGK